MDDAQKRNSDLGNFPATENSPNVSAALQNSNESPSQSSHISVPLDEQTPETSVPSLFSESAQKTTPVSSPTVLPEEIPESNPSSPPIIPPQPDSIPVSPAESYQDTNVITSPVPNRPTVTPSINTYSRQTPINNSPIQNIPRTVSSFQPQPQPQVFPHQPSDILLTDPTPEQKPKKLPIIIAASAIAAIILIAIIAIIAANSNRTSPVSALAAFNDLKSYIENGDGTVSIDTNKSDFLYAVAIYDQPSSIISDYYDKLSQKATIFFSVAKNNYNEADVNNYRSVINVLKASVNNVATRANIIDAYTAGGKSSAESYIDKEIACQASDYLQDLCSIVTNYYNGILEEHAYYATANCYHNGFYNTTCIQKYYDEGTFLNILKISNFNGSRLSELTSSSARSKINQALLETQSKLKEAA